MITSAWGMWKQALHNVVQSKTRNVWNSKHYQFTIITQKINAQMTDKICPVREHTATREKVSYNLLFAHSRGQIFVVGRLNVLWGRW